MVTFAELGIPFPLFEAPVDRCSDYVGLAECSLCNTADRQCFNLGIGARIVVPCPGCSDAVALDAYRRKGGACDACGYAVAFPIAGSERVRCCYECLRAGHAAIAKDTELGMVAYEHAVTGVTLGVPGLAHPDFELVPVEDDWVAAKVPTEYLLELVRTPGYHSIQGERWQFCCARPMTYVGQWRSVEFNQNASDGNGRALFDAIVPDAFDALWTGDLDAAVYVFQCKACGERAAHWDID